jgi:carboxymethylenebutenolidase
MLDIISITASDRHRFDAYCARPARPRAGLVVIQEVFGVTAHIRSVCDRFAEQGYLAIAPSLYDRVEPRIELPCDPQGVARGRDIRKQIPDDLAMLDVSAAIDAAVSELSGVAGAKVATIGYCWGGTLSWLAAARFPAVSAAVCYYGSGIASYLKERPRVPVLLHFGSRDAHIPVSDVDNIARAFPEVPVHLYDAGHGFNCDDRPSYDAPSAALAGERTLAFLGRHLAPA